MKSYILRVIRVLALALVFGFAVYASRMEAVAAVVEFDVRDITELQNAIAQYNAPTNTDDVTIYLTYDINSVPATSIDIERSAGPKLIIMATISSAFPPPNFSINNVSFNIKNGADVKISDVIIIYDSVTVSGGTFTMTDGVITASGSGVNITGGTFNMTGGQIIGSTATNGGGGVYVKNGGTFIMTGGSINNNTAPNGGGVYVENGGTFSVGGSAYVDANFADAASTTDNNVYLADGATIGLTATPAFTGKIGITADIPSGKKDRVIVGNGVTTDPIKNCFELDNSSSNSALIRHRSTGNTDNQLWLVETPVVPTDIKIFDGTNDVTNKTVQITRTGAIGTKGLRYEITPGYYKINQGIKITGKSDDSQTVSVPADLSNDSEFTVTAGGTKKGVGITVTATAADNNQTSVSASFKVDVDDGQSGGGGGGGGGGITFTATQRGGGGGAGTVYIELNFTSAVTLTDNDIVIADGTGSVLKGQVYRIDNAGKQYAVLVTVNKEGWVKVNAGNSAGNYGADDVYVYKGPASPTGNLHTLTLRADPYGGGSVYHTSVYNYTSGQYAAGTDVLIYALASPGWQFEQWITSSGSVGNAYSPSTYLTMPGNDVTVTARFRYTGSTSGGWAPLYGDVNGDGVVNNADLLRMLQWYSGRAVYIDLAAADVDGSGGTPNGYDLILLLRYFARPGVRLGPQ